MKNNDLTDRLNTLNPPEIDLPDHKNRLRNLLIQRHPLSSEPSYSGPLGRIRTGIMTGLFSRQPVWKAAILCTGVIGLVITAILIPSMNGNSVYAKAIDLIQYGQEIRNGLVVSDNQSQSEYIVTVDDGTGTAVREPNGTITIRFPFTDKLPDFIKDHEVELSIGKYRSDGTPVEGIPDTGTIIISAVQQDEVWMVEVVFKDTPQQD